MKEYFKLQFTMTNRRLKDYGFEPIIAYLIFTLLFIGGSFYLFYRTEFAEYIYMLFSFMFIGKLSDTSRSEFLKICFGDIQSKKIRMAENIICSIPFLIFILYKKLFVSAALLLALVIIMALVNFKTTLNYTIWSPFSKRPFEFTTGFRNSFYLFILAYALTVIAISVENFNLGIFAMLVVFATTLSYYSKPENEFYVWIFNQNAKQFLFEKIKIATLYSSLLALPILLMLGVFFNENINALLIFYIIGWAFLTEVIVAKYSAYPNEMNIPQGILLGICILFPPLLIILIPYLFKKSQQKLSYLLK